MHDPKYHFGIVRSYIDVPLGLADFPKEITNSPESWRRSLGPVVSTKKLEKGGHCAARERLQDLAGHLREMFGKGGGAESVIVKKSFC
jgi:hypothetical protein